MIRFIIPAALLVFRAAAGAQEPASQEKPAAEQESAAATEDGNADDELDDFVLETNRDFTKDDEDVFIPSEKVSFEQSIPFPTDI